MIQENILNKEIILLILINIKLKVNINLLTIKNLLTRKTKNQVIDNKRKNNLEYNK